MQTKRPRTGRLGETKFQELCEKADLVVNRVSDDNAGWDFVVDFPAPPSVLPADRAPAGVTAFVQVKATTDPGKRSWPVKLSNAMRFAQQPSACFTVIFLMKDGDPARAYLKHFWAEEIEQALAAARLVSVAGAPLHRKQIPMRFGEADEVPLDQLVERMEAIIRGIGPSYPVQKHGLGARAGEADQSLRITATFSGANPADRLLDAMVGDGGPLEAEYLKVSETRFGIAADREDLSGPGKIGFMPEGKPCELTFTSWERADSIVLPSLGFGGQLLGPKGLLRRLRVKAEFVELVCTLGEEGRFNISFDLSRPYPIQSILQISRIMTWMNAGEVDYSIDFKLGNLLHGTCQADEPIDDSWPAMAGLLEELLSVFALDRWPTTATFKIDDIFRSRREIADFVALLSRGGAMWAYVDLNPAIPIDMLRQVPSKLGVAYLELDGVTLFAIYKAAIISSTFQDSELRLETGVPALVRRDLLRGSAASNWQRMRDLIAAEWRRHPDGFLREDLPVQPSIIAELGAKATSKPPPADE